MNAPTPGLRSLYNRTKSIAKVEIRVQPGDVIHVPDDVADGLLSALDSHFSPVAAETAVEPAEVETAADPVAAETAVEPAEVETATLPKSRRGR